VYHTCTI